MKTLLLSSAAALLVLGVAVLSCDPDCTGKEFGKFVGDRNNCSYYYFCLGNDDYSPDPLPCPDGQQFDDEGGKCIEESAPHTCAECPGGDFCDMTCPPIPEGDSSSFAADVDCSQYYACLPTGSLVPLKCPADKPYFSRDEATCVADEEVCCSDLCSSNCPAAGVSIPDPNDCHRFYYCTQENTSPDETFHLTCGEGANFDLQKNKCIVGAECVTTCSGNISGPSTTTPAADTTTTTTADTITTTTNDATTTTTPSTTTTTTPSTTTTTTPSTTTTTTTPTTSSPCNEYLICPSRGYFPVCNYCDKRYLECKTIGEQATLGNCPGDLLFHPTIHYCVSTCP